MCVLKLISIIILPEISAHRLQLKCMGGHFLSGWHGKNWGVNAILWMYDLHVHVHVYHIHVHQNFCYLQTIFTNYPSFKKKQWKEE